MNENLTLCVNCENHIPAGRASRSCPPGLMVDRCKASRIFFIGDGLGNFKPCNEVNTNGHCVLFELKHSVTPKRSHWWKL